MYNYWKFTLTVVLTIFLITGCKTENKKQSNDSSSAASFRSEMVKSDKKKYYDQDNQVVYEIKYKPTSFKLRTPSSKLLWKVKLYENKVKISDNEENTNPYEIKKMAPSVFKLTKNDQKIARDSAITSFASMVGYITEIPKEQQSILQQELEAKGY
ncbi:MAG: hypothetical protein OIF50_06410 [Flavobacteriaceae bacterium]|nr:hypothetical protein [Flavobacteriaceae bacterium]